MEDYPACTLIVQLDVVSLIMSVTGTQTHVGNEEQRN